MARVALSTADNPYSPFTQFDEWLDYDESHGYYSCAYLARIAITSDELSDAEQQQAEEQAIDEIIQYNLLGNYVKVTDDSTTNVDSIDSNESSDQSESN